jgi:hypothetical protein
MRLSQGDQQTQQRQPPPLIGALLPTALAPKAGGVYFLACLLFWGADIGFGAALLQSAAGITSRAVPGGPGITRWGVLLMPSYQAAGLVRSSSAALAPKSGDGYFLACLLFWGAARHRVWGGASAKRHWHCTFCWAAH